MEQQESPWEGMQLTVNKLHFWAQPCPSGEHPAHPGETCEERDEYLAALVSAMFAAPNGES